MDIMAQDPQPTPLAAVDPWTVVADARRERARIGAEGCRTAVAWLYRGGSPSVLAAAEASAEPACPPPAGLVARQVARLVGRFRGTGGLSGSRPA
jgi:hypothetical protein